jgi:hypothetical protein
MVLTNPQYRVNESSMWFQRILNMVSTNPQYHFNESQCDFNESSIWVQQILNIVSTNPQCDFNESSIWFQQILNVFSTNPQNSYNPFSQSDPNFLFAPLTLSTQKNFLRTKNVGMGHFLPPPPFPRNLHLRQSQSRVVQPFVTNYNYLVVKVKLCVVMNSSRLERQTDDGRQSRVV